VFRGGLPAWKKAKQPVYTTAKFIKSFAKSPKSVVVMDLRSKASAQKGHIKGAYTLPLGELKAAKSKMPKKKKAPIVLYADSSQEAIQAFKIVRGWGYKNTSILKGGLASWKKMGSGLVKGALASRIVYIPKPVAGAIKVQDFDKVAKNQSSNGLILDVRDYDEIKTGVIKGSLHIPTQDVATNLSKIPKGKEIVIHCKSGVRASMAYQTLKENGYNVKFLNAKIKIMADGSYQIKL
jgi:rhodanese-related sulfurtransferase